MKPYYLDSSCTLYHADWREIADQLPRDAAVISDPPYGIDHVKGGGGFGKHNRRNFAPIHGDKEPFDPAPILAQWSNVTLWGFEHFAERLPHGRALVWDKLNGLPTFDSFSDVEIAWNSKRGAARIFRYLWKGICQAGDKDGGRQHPTQKPVPLMRWCIEQAGSPSHVVDLYAGSGSTLRAAKDLRIQSTGVEIEERYCEVIATRLAQEVLAL